VNRWNIDKTVAVMPRMKSPVMIEGLPGIGNVGKIAIDFIIDELKAKKIIEIFSFTFPHSVFVGENNLVELPTVSLYHHKTGKGQDILLLAGDVQPVDEVSSYEFSEKILDIVEEFKGRAVITLGGIGLPQVPKLPKIYCTGNSKKAVKEFTDDTQIDSKLYGIVGPIVGVSGVLLGLAKRRDIDAVTYLAETYGHPMYLGMKGAREIVSVLNKKFGLGIKVETMDKEISKLESEAESSVKGDKTKNATLEKIRSRLPKDASYIG